ncbi:hypothetical protein [Peterkaempfera griseoplana]|uniref:hypothetical protein n=1 Tax=Peterkaempfera griseoplana TaxID=66896 RepID=UPI0006E261ED|nr:hypothetical protein [Peterkaempfera griseoplana]
MHEDADEENLRLEHGCASATRQLRAHVEKRYPGPAADARREAEYLAPTRLRSRFPVPGVASGPGEEILRTACVPGVHAQDVLTPRNADRALALCGRMLRCRSRSGAVGAVPPRA